MSFGVETNRLNYVNTVYKPVFAPQQQTADVAFKGIPNIQKEEMSSDNKLLLTLGGLALAGIGIYLACRGKTSAAQNTVRTASSAGSKTAASAASGTASSAGAKAASSEQPLKGVLEEVADNANKKAKEVTDAIDKGVSKTGSASENVAASTIKPPIPKVETIPSPVVQSPAPVISQAPHVASTKPIVPVAAPPVASVPQKPIQTAASIAPISKTAEPSAAEIEAQVNKLWESKQKEIEAAFSQKRTFCASNTDCTMLETSAKDHLVGSIEGVTSIKDFNINQRQNLYHGTSKDAAAAIVDGGFDLSKCKRGEVGRGVYFGYNREEILKKYGDGGGVVTAKFTGNNVADVKAGVYYAVEGNTLFQMNLAEQLGLDFNNPQTDKIIKNIISRYYNLMLEGRNIHGIVVKSSINAGLPYFMVPNTKYIQIIK